MFIFFWDVFEGNANDSLEDAQILVEDAEDLLEEATVFEDLAGDSSVENIFFALNLFDLDWLQRLKIVYLTGDLHSPVSLLLGVEFDFEPLSTFNFRRFSPFSGAGFFEPWELAVKLDDSDFEHSGDDSDDDEELHDDAEEEVSSEISWKISIFWHEDLRSE